MDTANAFRQGLGSVAPGPPQLFFYPPQPPPPQQRDDISESDSSSQRIAHTLTACCRCRQRKTRCDPTLPRCLPCERSGSTCEYYDTAKGRRISRFYVVKLQDKVRQLEAELAQYTDEDGDYPRSMEDVVRPGGLVRLNETDETPRYLGPSSGIAMTRLLMEQAKRYTESKRISELIPELRARRLDRTSRMQSVTSMGGSISGPQISAAARKKSYPMLSGHPAQKLPQRSVADKIVDIYKQRAQFFTPILHEEEFAKDLDDVYKDSSDSYQNFVVRMVLAISLQKLDTQYAGLADSYWLAAMHYFEDVVRPKDLKTLQCLLLIGQYSLLTPTRTAAYYIVGLATRICQQLGLVEEKTVKLRFSGNPLTLDMARRMSWIVAGNEFGLAHTMGRPNGWAKGKDLVDVGFFEALDDEYITEEGIMSGPPSEKKLVAIHFCRMRLCQAEIRRIFYEKKRPEPKDDKSPLFVEMERKIQNWLDTAPQEPAWCRPWFSGRYHGMRLILNRPSPQIPKPSAASALKCYESAAFVINLSDQQVKKAAVDITWVFLIVLNSAVNALLWSVSYPEVRESHPREEVEEMVHASLDIIHQCSERWPGSQNASQLYSVLAHACLQSYDGNEGPMEQMGQNNFAASPSVADTGSPSISENSMPTTISSATSHSHLPRFNPPHFGYVFGSTPEQMATFNSYDADPFQHPTFRSNSIFLNPSTDPMGRRFSYFPPDFTQPGDSPLIEEATPPATTTPQQTPLANQLPTPPESLAVPLFQNTNSLSQRRSAEARHRSPTPTTQQPTPSSVMAVPQHASPLNMKFEQHNNAASFAANQHVPPVNIKFEPPETPSTHATARHGGQQAPPRQRTPTFQVPPLPPHVAGGGGAMPPQRPLPQNNVHNWFSPPPPFISPFAFSGGMGNGFWGDNARAVPPPSGGDFHVSLGASNLFSDAEGIGSLPPAEAGGTFGFPQFGFPADRQGSLSQEQQMELIDMLETEGIGEINSFLSMDMGFGRAQGMDNGGAGWSS